MISLSMFSRIEKITDAQIQKIQNIMNKDRQRFVNDFETSSQTIRQDIQT